MSDQLDANAFDATLSFVDDYVAELFAPTDGPGLTPSFSLSDATSSQLLPIGGGPVNGPSFSSSETLALPIAAAEPKKPQANPNRARNQLRFELAFLREKAVQLEQELASLKQRSPLNSSSLVAQQKPSTGFEAWRGIAARQAKRREGAERENSRLRMIVERQRKIAVDLGELLRKRAAECSHFKNPLAEERRLSRVLDFNTDISEFHGLFQHLEAAYNEVDAVLAANGLATLETPTNAVHIREGVDGKYLEFFANKVLPFGLYETAEAAWDHFSGVEKHCGNGGLYEKAAKNLDQPYTILEDFTKELHSNNSRADMKAKQIVRRHVESNRDIVVFVARASPVEIKHKAIPGLIYHLRGYVVTKPSLATTPGRNLTLLQFCSRISIDNEPGVIYDPERSRAAIRFIIGNSVGNIRCYQERIENALVDRALNHQQNPSVKSDVVNDYHTFVQIDATMDFLEDEDDMRAFEATLNFVEEYADDSVNPPGLPALADSSDASMEPLGAATSATMPLIVAEQLSGPSEAGFHMGMSTSQASKQRKSIRPRNPQANPNRVRNELRFELAYLREKLNPALCERGEMQEKVPSTQLSSSPQVICAWKGVATRQRQRREDAERENAKLRLIVDRQRKVVTDLSDLLRKRMAECMHVSSPYASESRLCRVIAFQGDVGEFRELFQHLEDAYHEVDDVLQANGLATMDVSTHDVHIREGVGGKYLEFFANKALPFGQQETSEAAWDHFKGVDKHWGNGGLYEKATKNLDQPYTVLEDFTKEMFSNNARADMQMKQIVRRYVEAERDMIVFVSRVSPIEIKNKAIAGLTYHLRGYVVTKNSPVSAPGHDLSLLQFCSRISIDKEPGVTYNPNHVRALTRFLIGNTVGNIRCYQERIENALVDRALKHGMELFDENDDDMRAFAATLSFVEEYASDSVGSSELPSLTVSSDMSNSFSFRLADELLPIGVVASPSPSHDAPVASVAANEPPTIDTISTRKRKPQANPNRARNELRFELAFLREKVTQLQQELQTLQPDSQPKMLCQDGARPSSQVLCAWKGVADRQRRRREDAERENARLRLNVERQRKVAVDLSNLLRKRMAECADAQDPSAKEHRFTRVLDFHGDMGDFQELFQHLEDAYHDLDSVFQDNGLATMDIPTEDVHIREGVGGKYLEFFANKVLPFSLDDTTEAAWDHFKGVEKHCGNGELYEKAAMNLDQPYTIIEDFTKEVYSNSSRADMQMKQIVRRFVEPDRDVVIFVCRVNPIEIKHKAIAGLTYHLRGYVVTKRAPASTPEHELSLLQFCSRISIDKEPGVAYDPGHVRALTRFLIGNTAGNIRCYQERIENALVDQALRRQCTEAAA
uniref:START domain-containing protein n=1 Tax=Phytophthora ramorum TaxID=164328 RepID=H3HDS3_PHYRM